MAKRTLNLAAAGSWATPANWLELAAPVTGDDVTVANLAFDLTGGYAQAAVTLATLAIPMTYTGKAGLATQAIQAVSTITNSTTTATLTTSAAHGYASGDVVTVSGSTPLAYNGTFAITVTGSTTFTYTMASNPGGNATVVGTVTKTAYLQLGATSWRVGDPSNSAAPASGSQRLKLDFGTTQFTGVVVNTATGTADSGLEPLRILGTHASNKLVVQGGRVGIATTLASETAQLAELNVAGNATVNAGSGLTLATLRMAAGSGADVNLSGGFTTGYVDGGTLTVNGTGAITTLYVTGATANLNSTGTITTLDVRADGHANLLNDYRPRTVTTIKLSKGSTLSYDPGVVTVTNPIQLVGCTLEDVTINTPSGVTVAIVKS